jgi:hypothetical protein
MFAKQSEYYENLNQAAGCLNFREEEQQES